MTYKRPLRLTILHLEQRLRMDAETFMILFSLISCQTKVWIIHALQLFV